MKVVIYGRAEHQQATGEFMRRGLLRHGLKPIEGFGQPQHPEECDLAIVWGHRWKQVIERQRRAGRDYLVMERGYFRDRFRFTSLGFNGLNGRADFCNAQSDGSRWAKHGVEMKPWHGGDYTLVIGRVPGDASLEHTDIGAWYRQVLDQASAPVYFRHHPLGGTHGITAPILSGPLEDALAGARLVVTFNSNAGVDAALAGAPICAYDRGSMAWDVASHDLKERVRTPDRASWAHRLAWCQWTPEEIETGEAWAHLKARYR